MTRVYLFLQKRGHGAARLVVSRQPFNEPVNKTANAANWLSTGLDWFLTGSSHSGQDGALRPASIARASALLLWESIVAGGTKCDRIAGTSQLTTRPMARMGPALVLVTLAGDNSRSGLP